MNKSKNSITKSKYICEAKKSRYWTENETVTPHVTAVGTLAQCLRTTGTTRGRSVKLRRCSTHLRLECTRHAINHTVFDYHYLTVTAELIGRAAHC